MRVVMVSHPKGVQIPVLLDVEDLPLPAPNEFIMGRRHLSPNTLVRNLRELAIFEHWLAREKLNLWEHIASDVPFTEALIRGSLIESLRREQLIGRKVNKLSISSNTFNQRLTTIRQYLRWCFDLHLSSLALEDKTYARIKDNQSRIVKWIDSSFVNSPPMNWGEKKGLSEKEVVALIGLVDPHSKNSTGYNSAVRFRNYIMTMIMLYFGLRPGEVLCLKVEDLEIGAISSLRIVRRPPDEQDPRKPRPRIKRNGRILPIQDPVFAKHLDDYIMIWRDILEAKTKKETDYLILSDEGIPLSQSTLTQYFQILRNRFSNDLPAHLTAKTLRHTFSSRMERMLRVLGLNEDRRRQALALLRGDSSLKSQNVYISQEIEEQANLALKNYQKKLQAGDENP